MSGNYSAVMGDRGRLVVPAELRERNGLGEGTVVVFVETDEGITMMTRDKLEQLVWRANRGDRSAGDRGAAGPGVVEDLVAERRQASREEDEDESL